MTNKIWDPLRGKERPDLDTQHSELPVRGLLAVKRDLVSDLDGKLDEMGWAPDLSGSTIGRRRPIAFSRVFGPIGMQAARNVPGAPGFLGNAPVVQPNTFILPTTTNDLRRHPQAGEPDARWRPVRAGHLAERRRAVAAEQLGLLVHQRRLVHGRTGQPRQAQVVL